MSSYLNFYLVPKKSKKEYDYKQDDGHTEIEVELSTGKPLLFMSYSRSSEIYQAYQESLNPTFIGLGEIQYTELTYDKSQQVIRDYEKDLIKTRERLKVNYKMLKEVGYSSELWEEIQLMEEHVREMEGWIETLNHISDIVYEVAEGYNDFEKVLINID